jgi:hypothetical protein
MTEKNDIKDIVAELVEVRIAIASLNPDPTLTIAAYQAEKQTALAATKTLAASTARLMWATWALVGVTILLALAALGPMVAMFRSHPHDWVLYKYGGGAVGTFKTLEDCQGASKRQPMSSDCYPRGVPPR